MTNRLPTDEVATIEGVELTETPPRSFPLAPQMVQRLNMMQAEIAVATQRRNGFLDGVRLALGVPDGYGFNLQRAAFEPEAPQTTNGAT